MCGLGASGIGTSCVCVGEQSSSPLTLDRRDRRTGGTRGQDGREDRRTGVEEDRRSRRTGGQRLRGKRRGQLMTFPPEVTFPDSDCVDTESHAGADPAVSFA